MSNSSQLRRRAGVRCTQLFRPGVAADSGVYHAEANSGCIWGSSYRDLFVDGSNCAKYGGEVFIGKESGSFESDGVVAEPARLLHRQSGNGHWRPSPCVGAYPARVQRNDTAAGVHFC